MSLLILQVLTRFLYGHWNVLSYNPSSSCFNQRVMHLTNKRDFFRIGLHVHRFSLQTMQCVLYAPSICKLMGFYHSFQSSSIFKSSNTRTLSSMEYFFNPVFPMWELPEKSLCWEISLATNDIIKNTNVHNSVNCIVWSLPVRNYSAIYLCKRFNKKTK